MKAHPSAVDPLLVDGLATGQALTVVADSQEFTPSLHRHPHGELFLLRTGYMKSQSDDGYWLIPAGHLCWIPPLALHVANMASAGGTRIHLSSSLSSLLPPRIGVFACNPLITAVIDRLASPQSPRSSLSESDELLLQVLINEVRHAPSSGFMLPMPRDPGLKRIAERWVQQPGDQAGLDELAADAGISRRTLSRNFRLETGLSVGHWRQVARLIHGFKMLIEGTSVTETAFSLGYDSTTSFVLLCQRHTGMSPRVLARIAEPVANR